MVLDRLVSLEAMMHEMWQRIAELENKTGITAERRKAEEKMRRALAEAEAQAQTPPTATAESWPFPAGKK